MRLGWIFKTESIVMPAVLDSIGGTGSTRGWLPLLSRFAMAIPPVFCAEGIRRSRYKKIALATFTCLMGVGFLALALLFARDEPWIVSRRKEIFLFIYAVFFIFTGLGQVAFGTLQGKLIPAALRGRLMLVASLVGASLAVSAVWLLLHRWLTTDGGDFSSIFAFTGSCFLLAGGSALLADEQPDAGRPRPGPQRRTEWSSLLRALRCDQHLRLLATVSTVGNCSILLFPHFQALGRERLLLDFRVIIVWVIIQNIGTAIFSSIAGALADRRGNRLVLQIILACLACVPPFALLLCRHASDAAAYGVVFFFVGLMPVFIRIVQNYTLEICVADNHPRYLAAITICNALPFVFAAPVGAAIDVLGYDAVFLAVAAVVAVGFLLSFRLVEPRDRTDATNFDVPF